MSNSQQPTGSFFDGRTMLAIGLTLIIWVGWQWHIQRKYPDAFKQEVGASVSEGVQEQGKSSPEVGATPAGKAESKSVENVNHDELGQPSARETLKENLIKVDFPNWSFDLSSQGMGLRNITLKKYNSRDGGQVQIGAEQDGVLPGETRLLGSSRPLVFHIERVGDNQWLGRAQHNGILVAKRLEVIPDSYRIDTEIEVGGIGDTFLGLTHYLSDSFDAKDGGSLFAPNLDIHEVFSISSQGEDRVHLASDTEMSSSYPNTSVALVGTPYFAQAVVDKSDVLPELKVEISATKGKILSALQYSQLNKKESMKVRFIEFLGPRSLEVLEGIDSNLARAVDFGFFSSLGRPILRLMKWFYGLVGNWGLAIIFLVLVVRFLVLPLHLMSYRSMKSMQVIQPKIQALREKYKSEPQKLNQEMMVLFKSHKVNPLGGCLPMLLQIPVFLALYQVIGHSVELYQAPFIFWIGDLSLKDPYYVLPILMGVTMFVQQKITPNTMDPAQAKILLMMPILFSFFMISLPSGLTLYFFVSGVFGIIQQFYFMKSSTPVS